MDFAKGLTKDYLIDKSMYSVGRQDCQHSTELSRGTTLDIKLHAAAGKEYPKLIELTYDTLVGKGLLDESIREGISRCASR